MAFDIERYLNVRSAYDASIGPDGEVAFLMDTTGVPQVWTLDSPGTWPEQRTFGDERVTFVDFSPTRSEFVFGTDEGGNERTQFHRYDLDSGALDSLTEFPEAKHRWGGWSHDGERFAFAANRRDRSVFDVYVQGRETTGEEADLIHEGEGWLTVGGFAPADDRLLVSEAHSSFDQDLYVLDLDSGEFEHVTPHEGSVRYGSANWGPEGEALYLATDTGSDTLSLCRLDLGSQEVETIVDDEWNVGGITLDEDTNRMVYTRNVDGYTDLTVAELGGETDLRELPDPDLPTGVAGGVSFDTDGTRFAITATGRRANANVYVIDAETGETRQWTRAPTAGIPTEGFVEPELLRYESFDGREIPAFFSLPASGANASEGEDGTTPVIVDIHGGPESQRRPSFAALTQYFLDRGFAVFEPNVRGSSGYGKTYTHLDDVGKRMGSVADIEAGVNWLQDHPAVDPDRIAAMGGSYGGFMVLAALTEYPDLWAAGVDIVGIADFTTFLENTGSWRRELREAEYGSLEDDRDFLESVSPLGSIERVEAPLFVLHGENDPRVPVSEARQVAEKAEATGVPVETLFFADEGHGFSKLENRIEAYTEIADFLDDHV
ncbi:S9 family peptidase [Halobacteriales archaeon QH_8_64_26]|nr:MAG: S9 family peptidase [Halobacteriales archaeon QH_8_64_26]